MPAQKTATAYDQGIKNALACGGLLSVCVLSGFAIWLITGRSFQESFTIASSVIFFLVSAWFFGVWLYGRNSGGEVLLDCGPHRRRKLFLLNAGVFIGLGALSLSKVFAVGGAIFGITFALYWVVLATGRLQIREDGIWMHCALMRWEKIGSYYWGKDSTLFLRGRGWGGTLFCRTLRVAPEQRARFDELLQHKCTATHGA
jgi:hypothetical protein